jgi:hypothetical protein
MKVQKHFIQNILNQKIHKKISNARYKKNDEKVSFINKSTFLKSCTLSSDGILVTTTDLQNHILYISSASTPNKELFENTRNACVRSLNVEVSFRK